MILKGSQRAGASQLANHLLNANDNDHITVHEISDFMADDVYGAFKEMEVTASRTQCQQFMFSLSLNPPMGEEVSSQEYEETIDRIGEELKLDGQPRVIVFHEKEGRIHAHAVWSRIDAQEMKAINLPFFKRRLMEISRDIYLEKGWDLPDGFMDHEKRDPLNYTLEEYQQAKRMDQNPKLVKRILQTCWGQSDNRASFEAALKQQGYFLSRGDRRGFVAVSMTGEPLSLSRWLSVKTKELKARLGDPKDLSSMAETLNKIEANKTERFNSYMANLQKQKKERLAPLLSKRRELMNKQRVDRERLLKNQKVRAERELALRQARFRTGFKGLWDRVSGAHGKLKAQIEAEYQASLKRDRHERDQLRWQQLKARNQIVSRIQTLRAELQKQRTAMAVLITKKHEASTQQPSRGRGQQRFDRSR